MLYGIEDLTWTRVTPSRLLEGCAAQFALPLVTTIRPKLVIAFGVPCFNALRKAAGLNKVRNLAEAFYSPYTIEAASVRCQSHPGGLGRANRNRGGLDRVSEDWQRMARWFKNAV